VFIFGRQIEPWRLLPAFRNGEFLRTNWIGAMNRTIKLPEKLLKKAEELAASRKFVP
jgi:hypothetical protein